MPRPDTNVVIVGAGIGGLTTALALHAHGVEGIVILESAKEIRPLGVGINIQPAAVAELARLGLQGAMAALAIATRELWYVDQSGQMLWAEPRGIAGGQAYPQYSVHRGALQALLLREVEARLGMDVVRRGVQVRSIEQNESVVCILAQDRNGEATVELQGRVLIGADGLHSAVRSALHPGHCKLSYGDIHMWRGLAEMDAFLDGHTMIIANDQRSTRLIAYPICLDTFKRGKALVNWVCMVPNALQEPSLEADWNCAGRIDDVLPLLRDWNLGWLDVEALISSSREILQYPMVDRDPLCTWRIGRATLLGDAAHLMYPVGANGASQAILDAACIAERLATTESISAALQLYEAERLPATSAVVQANRRRDDAERQIVSRTDQEKAAALQEITQTYRATVENPRPRARG